MSSNICFTDLPTELLCEIARRTDGKTLLSLRKTCWTLYCMTKTQIVWSNIVQDLEAQPGSSSVEKPRAECTAQELESWALERLRVRKLYESLSRSISTQPTCSEYTLPEQVEVTECYLLPGGKRLLVFTRPKGTVYQCDLGTGTGSSTGKRILELIPGRCYNEEVVVDDDVRYAIWIDKTQSRLTFRLALYSRFWCSEKNNTRAVLYHVSLSSSGAQLEAVPIVTFPLSRRDVKLSAALDENRFYLVSKDPAGDGSELSIHSYNPLPYSCSKAVIDTDAVIKVRLLPNERLLVVCKRTLKIYDLSSIQLDEPQPHDPELWWQLPPTIQLRSKQFMEPIFTPNYTRLAFVTDGAEVLGLSIPHNRQSFPWISPLALNIDSDLYYCSSAMGHLGSIFLDWRSRVHILRYSWDKLPRTHSRTSFDEEFVLFNSEFNMAVDRIVGMSEERGRIVLLTGKRNVAVIDLLPS